MRFLTKDVPVMITTLLRFEVIGEYFDGSFVFITLFRWFWYGKSFAYIDTVLLKLIALWYQLRCKSDFLTLLMKTICAQLRRRLICERRCDSHA